MLNRLFDRAYILLEIFQFTHAIFMLNKQNARIIILKPAMSLNYSIRRCYLIVAHHDAYHPYAISLEKVVL